VTDAVEPAPAPADAPLDAPAGAPAFAPAAPVDDEELRRLRTVLAPLGDVVSAARLTGGFFATSYRVELATGAVVVVKTAPADTSRLLRYEHDLVRAEALVYEIGATRPELLMPRLLLTDFSRSQFAGDVVVASFLPGMPWQEAGFGAAADDARAARAQRELGALMARLHRVTGPHFGYLVEGSGLFGATWPEAFERILLALLDDARRWEVEVPDAEIRAAFEAHRDALAEVTVPVLVHHDLWPGNLFVDPATGELLGVIDPERGLWGDPLLEVVAADQEGKDTAPAGLMAGYAAQAGAPLDLTSPGALARMRLYRVMWSLIWMVEATPREYEGEFAAWYVATARANLRTALDQLA